MAKRTRFDYLVAQCRGVAKTITENTTLTAANILGDGNGFIKITGAYTLTLPAAQASLEGVTLFVFGNNASSAVTVAAGFGGGGASFDTVTLGAYCTAKFKCDGTNWYAFSEAVAAS